jgi:DNA-directed RNA polymerase specialized sigma24 family protein
VALFYVDGYPRRAIGQILGISDESVKTHLDRARPSLQRLLGETRE